MPAVPIHQSNSSAAARALTTGAMHGGTDQAKECQSRYKTISIFYFQNSFLTPLRVDIISKRHLSYKKKT